MQTRPIRLRLPSRITSVKVGFDEELDRVYSPSKKGDETEAKLGLDDFVDYSQIDQRLNEDASFNVQCGKEVMALIRVSADPIPEIIAFTLEPAMVTVGETATLNWLTQNTEVCGVVIDSGLGSMESSGSMRVTPSETTTYTLRLTAPDMDDVTRDVTVEVRARPQPEEKLIAQTKRTGGGWRPRQGVQPRRDSRCGPDRCGSGAPINPHRHAPPEHAPSQHRHDHGVDR